MNLDHGAVERHRLDPEAHDPLALQLLEHPVQNAVLRPPVHPSVDRVPVAEPGWQAAPLAAMFGDIQDGVENLPVRQADIAALHRKVRRNAGVLGFREFHPKTIIRIVSLVLTGSSRGAR